MCYIKIRVCTRIHTFCLHEQVTAFDVKLLPYSHTSTMGTHNLCMNINNNKKVQPLLTSNSCRTRTRQQWAHITFVCILINIKKFKHQLLLGTNKCFIWVYIYLYETFILTFHISKKGKKINSNRPQESLPAGRSWFFFHKTNWQQTKYIHINLFLIHLLKKIPPSIPEGRCQRQAFRTFL